MSAPQKPPQTPTGAPTAHGVYRVTKSKTRSERRRETAAQTPNGLASDIREVRDGVRKVAARISWLRRKIEAGQHAVTTPAPQKG